MGCEWGKGARRGRECRMSGTKASGRGCEGEPVGECKCDDDDEVTMNAGRATVTNDNATGCVFLLRLLRYSLTAAAIRRRQQPPPPHVNSPAHFDLRSDTHITVCFLVALYPRERGARLIVPAPCSQWDCPRLSRNQQTPGRVPSGAMYRAPPRQ